MQPQVYWMILLRDAIGRFLPSDEVEAVFVEAVATHGHAPEEDELAVFVDKALDAALSSRLNPVMRRAIIRGAHSIAAGTLHDTRVPMSGEYKNPGGAPATPTPEPGACTRFVLVAAGSKNMETGVRQAEPVEGCRTVRDVVTLHSVVLTHAPGLWIIDGTDPPALPAHEIKRGLGRLPGPPIVVVWGPSRPYGKAVLAELRGGKPEPMTLTENEPDALLDLVRSLRSKNLSSAPMLDTLGDLEDTPARG